MVDNAGFMQWKDNCYDVLKYFITAVFNNKNSKMPLHFQLSLNFNNHSHSNERMQSTWCRMYTHEWFGGLWNYIKLEEYSLVYEGGKKTLMTSQEKYLSEYHVTFVCSIMVSEGAKEIVLMVNLLHTFLGAWAWGILLKRVLWSPKLWGTLASLRQGLQSESMSLENQNRCCPGGVRGSKCFTSVSVFLKQGGERIILSCQKCSMSFKAPQSILCLRCCYWTSPAGIPTLPFSGHFLSTLLS